MPFNNWNPENHDIFRSGPDDDLNACVGNNGGPYDFLDYGRGYLLAAQTLCEDAASEGYLKDLKIYPTVFLFRHSIELYLKGMLIHIPARFSSVEEPGSEHDLSKLWEKLKPYLERKKQLFDDGHDAIAFVDKVISDMRLVDSNAQAFRYPCANDGKLHLVGRFTHINYGVLLELIEQLFDVFEVWLEMHDRLLRAEKTEEISK